jgi:hypothetical protein
MNVNRSAEDGVLEKRGDLSQKERPPSTYLILSSVFVCTYFKSKGERTLDLRARDPSQAARLIGKRMGGEFLGSSSVTTGNRAEISSAERRAP